MSTGKETGTSDRGRSSPGTDFGVSRFGGSRDTGFSGSAWGFFSAVRGGFAGSV
jgi:hypothetical protein